MQRVAVSVSTAGGWRVRCAATLRGCGWTIWSRRALSQPPPPPPQLLATDPATEAVVPLGACDSAESVLAKAAAARAAQGAWAATPLEQRAAALRRFAAALATNAEQLARDLTLDTGKPLRQARAEVLATPARVDFFTAHAAAALQPLDVSDPVAAPGVRERVTHEPLGVVACVSAWNYPFFVGSNVFVPALLTGNAVLYKPSEHATRTGLNIARLLHDAGVPPAVFAPLIGGGEVGARLVALNADGQRRLDAVSFVGTVATGRRIASACAPALLKLQLELGGKDPSFVADDADLAAAAASLADGAMYNSGQSCCSVERIYVHESVYAPFVERFVGEVRAFKLGAPLEPDTYIGPLARRDQVAVLEAQVRDAQAKGARLLLGGKRTAVNGRGFYFEPTVLADCDHSMRVMLDESFGPIIGIQSVRDDDEALALMNDSEYGLTAGVYSRSQERAHALLSRVHAGSVYWNICDRVSPRLPWSGRRNSGLGLTLSVEGLRTFTAPKAWHERAPK